MTHLSEKEQADRLFAGPGEMRSLMRELDWSSTAVGPIETWSTKMASADGFIADLADI